MGKHLFEYADYKAYAAEIAAGRAKIDEQLAKLDPSEVDVKLAAHGMLVGLINRMYTRYEIEDSRLAALVAKGELAVEDTPAHSCCRER